MFDITQEALAHAERRDVLHQLQAFAEEHGAAVLNAAAWLGGHSGSRCALEALGSLHAPEVAPRRVLRLCGDLLALLMLEHVHEPEREEADIFAVLDPRDPRVEDVCLLADGLATALRACREAIAGTIADDDRRAAA